MRENGATRQGTITRRGACGWLLAAILAACGGPTDVQPAGATATAGYINTAVSASVAAAATGAAASTVTVSPAPPPSLAAEPVSTLVMPRVAGTVAAIESATPTPLSAGVATGTRPASTVAATVGLTPNATRSITTTATTTTTATSGTATGTAPRATATGSATGAANATGTVTSDAVPFTDPGKRITFSRPRTWRDAPALATSRDFVVSYLSTMPRGSFNVLASSVPPSATLDQYTSANIATIKRDVMGYRDGPVGLQSGDLGGVPARLYDFFATVGGESQLVTQIYCVRGGTLYVLSFITPTDTTPDEERGGTFYDAAQVIVDTWKFL